VSPSERTAQQIASLYGATFVDSDTAARLRVAARRRRAGQRDAAVARLAALGSLSTWSARLNSTCHEFASLHLSATQKDFLLGVDGYSLLLERGFPLDYRVGVPVEHEPLDDSADQVPHRLRRGQHLLRLFAAPAGRAVA
jgi:hypothetical protein